MRKGMCTRASVACRCVTRNATRTSEICWLVHPHGAGGRANLWMACREDGCVSYPSRHARRLRLRTSQRAHVPESRCPPGGGGRRGGLHTLGADPAAGPGVEEARTAAVCRQRRVLAELTSAGWEAGQAATGRRGRPAGDCHGGTTPSTTETGRILSPGHADAECGRGSSHRRRLNPWCHARITSR